MANYVIAGLVGWALLAFLAGPAIGRRLKNRQPTDRTKGESR